MKNIVIQVLDLINAGWMEFVARDVLRNFQALFLISIILLAITFVGVMFFRALIKTENIFYLIPAGMVTGSAVFVLYLGLFSHIFKGGNGLKIIFLLFILSGYFMLRKHKCRWKLLVEKSNVKNTLLYILVLFIAFLFFVKAGNVIFGGDAITYWGLSTSFANGNYPQVLPWQPQYLTVHHQGAFLLLGAIHGLTKVDIRQIHFLYAFFIISGGFLMLWGYFYEKTKKVLLSFTFPLFVYFVFGGFFIPLPKSILGEYSAKIIDVYPIIWEAKGSLGTMASIFDMYYVLPRSMALAILFLVFILLFTKNKLKMKNKLLTASLLSTVVLSVDETIFSCMIFPIIIWGSWEFIKTKNKSKLIKNAIYSFVIFFTLFWVIGNPVRDSLLTPSPEAPRFAFVSISESLSQGRLNFLKNSFVDSTKTPGIVWYLPDYRMLFGIGLIAALFSGSSFSILLIVAAFGATLFYFLVEHTFWPGNSARFLLIGYQFIGASLGTAIVRLFSQKKILFKYFGYLLLLLTLPSIFSSFMRFVQSIPDINYSNFAPITTRYKVLDWVTENLAYDAKVFFVDGFLHGDPHSDLTLHGTQGYGLFIPTSSSEYKMHTQEWGPEAVDVLNTISPQSIGQLDIEYIYIVNSQRERLSKDRMKDINNADYFEQIYQDDIGILFKVSNAFVDNAGEESGRVVRLGELIPKGSKIYFDNPPINLNYYLRKVMFLILKDNRTLYSKSGNWHYNYVETFIETLEPMEEERYDYFILGPDTDIEIICGYCQDSDVIWNTEGARLYEVN